MLQNFSPQQDTGWGVIYRLNGLFAEIETLAPSGKYDEWNIKLDRIWSNLLYRNPMDILRDEKTKKIKEIKFEEGDLDEKIFLDNKIIEAKRNLRIAQKKNVEDKVSKNYTSAKNELYKALLTKEIWLRKFMYKLGLYLKESKHNPAGAMWGK